MATQADRQELQSRASTLAIQFAVLLELRQQSLIDGPEKYEEITQKTFENLQAAASEFTEYGASGAQAAVAVTTAVAAITGKAPLVNPELELNEEWFVEWYESTMQSTPVSVIRQIVCADLNEQQVNGLATFASGVGMQSRSFASCAVMAVVAKRSNLDIKQDAVYSESISSMQTFAAELEKRQMGFILDAIVVSIATCLMQEGLRMTRWGLEKEVIGDVVESVWNDVCKDL